jgi:hypothetical protein
MRPRTDDISLADALAFEAFTDEQKRIAFAGVAMHDVMEDKIEEARREGFDDGITAGRRENIGGMERGALADEIDEQVNFLALAIPAIPVPPPVQGTIDELRDIRRKLTDIVDRLRHG